MTDDIMTRLRQALDSRDDADRYTVVTRSLLRHLLSEALAAIEQRDAQISQLCEERDAMWGDNSLDTSQHPWAVRLRSTQETLAQTQDVTVRAVAERDALRAERDRLKAAGSAVIARYDGYRVRTQ